MKSNSFVSALLLMSMLATGATAQTATKPDPRLIVAISVDQFSADLFTEYRQFFTGGLGRLSREGVVFPSGYQSHAATETCPGHSTILTGVHPDRTGIIANDWYEGNASIYCAKKDGKVSADRLEVPTLGDRMEVSNAETRSVAVAGKDRAAVMMGGHGIDRIWWWDGDKAAFVGLDGQAASPAVDQINKEVTAKILKERAALDLPAACAARDHDVVIGGSKKVGAGRFARPAGNAKAFRASPDLDRAILKLAAALVMEMKLDEGPATNLLAIGLSATDYVGHVYGTEGAEMCIQLLALDRELGYFFDELDATGVDYAVVLTADHGGYDIPERNKEHAAATAARVNPGLDVATIGQAIATELELKEQVLYGVPYNRGGDIYVNKDLSKDMQAKVLEKAEEIYEAHSQEVAEVFTQAELQAVPRPTGPPESWSLAERARASFHAQRSGDLIVLLKPRVMPIQEDTAAKANEYVATHGSPWDYDRRVPILFWRRGITPFEQPLSVETVDIAPTLAALIKLQIPAGELDGKCLDLDAGSNTTCK